jgi:hypothetical protein
MISDLVHRVSYPERANMNRGSCVLHFFLRVNVTERLNSFLLHHGCGYGAPPHNLLVSRCR